MSPRFSAAGNPVASVLRRAARPDGTASAAAASDAAAASKAEPFMFSILTPAFYVGLVTTTRGDHTGRYWEHRKQLHG
jgi:hypothetical protein